MLIVHQFFSSVIILLKAFPHFHNTFHINLIWSKNKFLHFKSHNKGFCFWSIRKKKKRNLMNTRKYCCMESHTNNRIKCRIYFESILNYSSSIICLSAHDSFYECNIILFFISRCRMYKKNRIISLLNKIFIYLWYNLLIISEESSSK